MKVLVTGGLGGVGYRVTRRLLETGVAVKILELDSPRGRKRLGALSPTPEVVWGDVTDKSDVKPTIEDVDIVVHMAAVLPPRANTTLGLAEEVNVGGTRAVVAALRSAGRRRPLIYTSSIAVFGDTCSETPPLHPDSPLNPSLPYEKSKVAAETLVRDSGLDYLILRLGATPYLDLSLSTFREMFSQPYDCRIEFTHVEDTATGIVHAVQRFEKLKNRILIVSGGPRNQMYYYEFITRALGELGLPCPPEDKFFSGPAHLDWYDTSESQELLEYQTRTLEDYLRDVYQPIPGPARALMRRVVGPLFGRLIVRLL